MRMVMVNKVITTRSNTINIQTHIKQDEYVMDTWSCLVSHSISMLVWKQYITSARSVFCHRHLSSVPQHPLLLVVGVYQCGSCMVVSSWSVVSCHVVTCRVMWCLVPSMSCYAHASNVLCGCLQSSHASTCQHTCMCHGQVWCRMVWYSVVRCGGAIK